MISEIQPAAYCLPPPARVLVVDDEADIRELVGFNLRAAGLEVLFAASGTAAIDCARRERPDLVILDLMLPELDGVSVCELIRKYPETADTPVIMLTAWATDGARLIGLQAGADDYVTKPFSPRELVRRVQLMLHDRSAAGASAPARPMTHVAIDLSARRVVVDGRELEIDARGFRLLAVVIEALFQRAGGLTPPAPNT